MYVAKLKGCVVDQGRCAVRSAGSVSLPVQLGPTVGEQLDDAHTEGHVDPVALAGVRGCHELCLRPRVLMAKARRSPAPTGRTLAARGGWPVAVVASAGDRSAIRWLHDRA